MNERIKELSEQAEQEPVAIVVCNRFGVISLQRPDGDNFNLGKNVGMKFYTAPQPVKQEPVAWKHDCAALCANDVELWIDNCPHCGKPRTAAPVRTKDLTDKEIVAVAASCWFLDGTTVAKLNFARDVIAADREKNK